jgi:hypothetical protein
MSKGRKIGHINIVGATREETRQRLAAIEAAGEQSLRWVECRARGALHSVVRVVMVSLSPSYMQDNRCMLQTLCRLCRQPLHACRVRSRGDVGSACFGELQGCC